MSTSDKPSDRLRLLFVQPTADKKGHFGLWTVKLCQALAKIGNDVTLCTNKVDVSCFLREAPAFSLLQVESGRYVFADAETESRNHPLKFWFCYYRNSFAITLAALRFCREHKIDVVFITDTEFLVASLLLKCFDAHPPVVMQVNAANFSFQSYVGSPIKKMYKVMQRELFRRTLGKEVSALSVLGEWHRDRLRVQLRAPAEFPIEVVPDAGEVYEVPLDRSGARQALGIAYVGPMVLFFGILRRDKGIEHLLEATALVGSRGFKVLIAGAPVEYDELELAEEIRRLGIGGSVVLRAQYIPEEEVPLYFRASDVLVLPYGRNYTGGSGPLLKQACTYSLPVIASDVSELGRLVKHHGIGLVSPPEDSMVLGRTIEEFFTLPRSKVDEMVLNTRRLARCQSWAAVAERLSSVCTHVANKTSAQRAAKFTHA
jgi:glycosyltransferase involved in cell wall biosynthesis